MVLTKHPVESDLVLVLITFAFQPESTPMIAALLAVGDGEMRSRWPLSTAIDEMWYPRCSSVDLFY